MTDPRRGTGTDDGTRAAYAAAGVDVSAGDRAVELIRERLASRLAQNRTGGVEVLAPIGGFGAAVALPGGYREPVLVSATDGVGTKTAIAAELGRYDTIGHDLVAMCADDVVCLGARPLFFLDYVAVGRLEPATIAAIVAGVAAGCELAGCALVGGETAEHPGLMEPDRFDLAGFCVGIAERSELLDGSAARPGDVLLGLAASGFHANGYSLVRAVLEQEDLPLATPYLQLVAGVLGPDAAHAVRQEEPGSADATLGEVLLLPTRIYAAQILALREALDAAGAPLAGLAHVTGGGLPGNVPRALPDDLGARVRPGTWRVPSPQRVIASLAGLDGPQLRATFNAGVGMVAVVPGRGVNRAVRVLGKRGIEASIVGDVVSVEELGGARYLETT